MQPIDSPYLESYQGFDAPAGGSNPFTSLGTGSGTGSSLIGSNFPTAQYDISVLSGLSDSAKYGSNRVSDIKESYQTYITGNPVGRGGQYAIDAAKKYGTTLTEAARGYLQAAGIPILSQLVTPSGTTPPTIPDTPTTPTTPTTPNTPTDTIPDNPFKLLVDEFKSLFGTPVYNPPLQNQSSGYVPSTSLGGSSGASSSGGSSIGIFVIVAVIAAVGYFLYKRYAK